jgi:hypothetical protein
MLRAQIPILHSQPLNFLWRTEFMIEQQGMNPLNSVSDRYRRLDLDALPR